MSDNTPTVVDDDDPWVDIEPLFAHHSDLQKFDWNAAIEDKGYWAALHKKAISTASGKVWLTKEQTWRLFNNLAAKPAPVGVKPITVPDVAVNAPSLNDLKKEAEGK